MIIKYLIVLEPVIEDISCSRSLKVVSRKKLSYIMATVMETVINLRHLRTYK